MWSQILPTNSADILQQLAEYQQVLDLLAQKINDRDEAALYQYFAAAKSSRDQLRPAKSVVVDQECDLLINIPDKVGSLAKVTQLLAEAEISLVNLQILDADGVLLLVFAKGADRDRARTILAGHFPEVGQI